MSDEVLVPKITMARHRAMGRVFAAEIEGRLPFQSRAKVFKELAADGLLEFGSHQMGGDRLGAIIVDGYTLTPAGRFIYCVNCDERAWPESHPQEA